MSYLEKLGYQVASLSRELDYRIWKGAMTRREDSSWCGRVAYHRRIICRARVTRGALLEGDHSVVLPFS